MEDKLDTSCTRWITIPNQGLVCVDRIVAVGPASSAAMRRLLGATPLAHVIGLTGGRKRHSILVLDSGHVAITALEVEEIERLLLHKSLGKTQ